jgi:hypothetical protein
LRLPALYEENRSYVLVRKLVEKGSYVGSTTAFAIVQAGTTRYRLFTNVPGHLEWESECGQILTVGQVMARTGTFQDEEPREEPYVTAERITDVLWRLELSGTGTMSSPPFVC